MVCGKCRPWTLYPAPILCSHDPSVDLRLVPVRFWCDAFSASRRRAGVESDVGPAADGHHGEGLFADDEGRVGADARRRQPHRGATRAQLSSRTSRVSIMTATTRTQNGFSYVMVAGSSSEGPDVPRSGNKLGFKAG